MQQYELDMGKPFNIFPFPIQLLWIKLVSYYSGARIYTLHTAQCAINIHTES